MSQFVRDLNTIHDPEESYGPFEDDLALFTNSQFFDIETGQTTADFQPAKMVVDRSETEQTAPPDEATSASTALGDLSGMDFISGMSHFLCGCADSPASNHISHILISHLEIIICIQRNIFPQFCSTSFFPLNREALLHLVAIPGCADSATQ